MNPRDTGPHPLKGVAIYIKKQLEDKELGEKKLWVSDRHVEFQQFHRSGFPVHYCDHSIDENMRIFLKMCYSQELYDMWKKQSDRYPKFDMEKLFE